MTTTQAPTEPAVATPAPSPKRPADRPTGETGQPPIPGLPQLTRLLGTIVAPTTLLTSLLFYFGWSHAFWYSTTSGSTPPCSA